jgi:tryptophan-rich sensory protein|uniref:TspO/MBR family protein n=1 Tax=viral metagenome TaxID=1070528 RepID=A0A6C0C5G9_9ZZZZ
MNRWYRNLKKAPFSPPGYIFGIIWPILYIFMGVSTYTVWTNKKCYPYCSAITYFNIQLFFNLIWTTLFFTLNMPKLALLDIVLILGFSIATFIKYFNINKLAAYILIPYILWLCLAFSLNAYIVIYN